MSVMVSARIADEIAVQGADLLKKNGHTVTALINAAYEYYLRYGELPSGNAPLTSSSARVLSSVDKNKLSSLFLASSMKMGISSDVAADKKALMDAKAAKYAALA